MKKIIVLGAGLVGKAIAFDLHKQFAVTSADVSADALSYLQKKYKIKTLQFDISDKKLLKQKIKDFDLVVCAVPGFMGFETLKTIIEAGKNVVDISFFPENSLELDALAKKNNVTAVVDCGVAPGMDNVILGYYNELMDVNFFECLVGGLPVVRKFPFEYKAPFSPIDVIEEYTRPARYMENGFVVTKPAMSDTELINFSEVGTLESFNTDGLRSLLYTMKHIPDMKEKTLRYPGHIQFIQALKAAGFLDNNRRISVNGMEINPLQFSSKLLIDEWKSKPDEDEFTIMRISINGKWKMENGKWKNKKIIYNLYDRFDKVSGISSMARTTGYTCTAAVNLIAKNIFKNKGVFPPELVGKYSECFNFFMNYLKQRNVIYKEVTSDELKTHK